MPNSPFMQACSLVETYNSANVCISNLAMIWFGMYLSNISKMDSMLCMLPISRTCPYMTKLSPQSNRRFYSVQTDSMKTLLSMIYTRMPKRYAKSMLGNLSMKQEKKHWQNRLNMRSMITILTIRILLSTSAPCTPHSSRTSSGLLKKAYFSWLTRKVILLTLATKRPMTFAKNCLHYSKTIIFHTSDRI